MTIKKTLYVFVLPLLLLAAQLFAQERQVTGRVTDSAGAPVSNASVVVKGARNGAQTGTDGSFSIRVPSSASHFGYYFCRFCQAGGADRKWYS